MIHITSKELLILARAARLNLPNNAQERLVNKLEAVLSYAELLSNVQPPVNHEPAEPQKFLSRDDTSISPIAEQLLGLAPETEGHYFVVPVVITSTSQ
jgi:aspartyl/glutamyl-tRNA(Asn/Gln) amidotransferase C subunit